MKAAATIIRCAAVFAWCAMMVCAFAFLMTHTRAETVEYHRFGGDVYGTDGSRSHSFGDKTYTDWPDGRRRVCRETDDHNVRCD